MPRRTKRVLTDDHWERIAALLPEHPHSPKGGRPWVDERECLQGILWLLRSGSRWRDMPIDLPSGSTCWRRLREWAGEGILEELHALLLEELHELGEIDFEELFSDATFIRTKEGGDDVGNTKAGKGMKLQIVTDASGLPLGLEVAAADVSEQQLLMPALEDVPVEIPPGTPPRRSGFERISAHWRMSFRATGVKRNS